MDTKKLPPALLMALGLSGCGGGDDGTATTGPCLIAPMTSTTTETGSEGGTAETTTGPCLFAPMSTSSESSGSDSGSGSGSSSESGSGDGTTLGPCLDAPPPTSTSGSESGDGSTGPMGADDRDEVVRTLVGRGILPDDVAAKLGKK